MRVVKRKSDKQLYAMKYINKAKCIEQKAIKNTIFERNLLENIKHPLMVNLRYAFQDEENMFMVLDLMLGGDLKYHMQQYGGFEERNIRVFAAEISCALMYLHSQGVVHRDIKPDNVLLSEDGHAHLTDFNVAALLPEDGSKLTSISGTIAYMAPEVINRSGYREAPDFWSLGVTLFELMYGKRPFRGSSAKELCSRIVEGSFEFPPSKRRFSEDCYDFIIGLLQRNPEKRLGVGQIGIQRLKAHPFMKGISWDEVAAKKLPVYFKPSENRNFDPMHEAEDILLEEKPLKPGRRKASEPETDPDLLYIQEHFLDYNWRKELEAQEAEARLAKIKEESRALESIQQGSADVANQSHRASMFDMKRSSKSSSRMAKTRSTYTVIPETVDHATESASSSGPSGPRRKAHSKYTSNYPRSSHRRHEGGTSSDVN